jgi:glycosyltransferase involved in cell wall biosynthesis
LYEKSFWGSKNIAVPSAVSIPHIRMVNIICYFFRALIAACKSGKQDYIFAISQPPILGGILGVCGKWLKRAKLIYTIQDYNPEQVRAVNYLNNKLILKIMMELDKFSCKRAAKVIVVGRDMIPTMTRRFTNKKGKLSRKMPKTVFINNWMDEREIYPLSGDDEKVKEFKKKYGLENKFVIMYSGNIGLYYDLENLIKVIEKFKDREDVVFPFVGAGSKKDEIEKYAKEHEMKNVVFIPYQPKEDLIYSLNAADVHWIVNAEGIKGVSCPSKLYGILAVAKPALAVLEEGTEARDIIETTGCGYAVSPKDYDGIEVLIEKFISTDKSELCEIGKKGHEFMKEHLTREISIEKYREEIRSC